MEDCDGITMFIEQSYIDVYIYNNVLLSGWKGGCFMMRIYFNNDNSDLRIRDIDKVLDVNNSISDILQSLKWFLSLKILKKLS